MGEELETRERLLKSAMAEFSEKGYMKASLRKICADAGVTTGALYFFFKNKNDLFAAIVEPPLTKLRAILEEHNREDEQALSSGGQLAALSDATKDDHKEIAENIVDFLYDNYDAFMLLLTKSQGSAYENVQDEFVAIMEDGFRKSAQALTRSFPGCRVNEYMLHWLAHMDLDVYIHLLTHETDREQAKIHSLRIMQSIVESWFKLIITKE